MNQITGSDVIGLPGQKLTDTELRVLVGLADGETPTQLARAINADPVSLRHIERDVGAKLGAKTKPHIVTRGFVTGVLMTRALCLMLCLTMAFDSANDGVQVRVRTARTLRIRTRKDDVC